MVILWIVLGILSAYAGIKLLGVAFSYIDYATAQLKKNSPRKVVKYIPNIPNENENEEE